jgi:hypothetical protein
MPIWLRKFTYNKIYQHYKTKYSKDDTEDVVNKSISVLKQAKADNIIPKEKPTYTTKVSKK